MPVRLWIDYKHRGMKEDSFLVQISTLAGALSYSLELPVVRSSGKGMTFAQEKGSKKRGRRLLFSIPWKLSSNWRELRDSMRFGRGVFRFFRRQLKIKRFVWHTELGMRESHRLAIITGSLWAVKGMALSYLYNLYTFTAPPVIRVLPRFNKKILRVAFSCILEFPLGYAIMTAFFAGFQAIKLRLKRRGASNGRTSNPGSDEDSYGKYQGNGRCEYSNRRCRRGS
ncbi:MAG TPA: DUF2953 domain-containing protein [Bacillota bacterium]|nr:DUF2953 domain-containing protein [Bacillota bacterium]